MSQALGGKHARAVLVVVLFASSILHAQNTGTITGTVTDPAAAVLPNANVTVTNQATGVALSGSTNSEGSFVFTPLNAATYKLTVEAAGFRVYNQENIVLNVNSRIGLPTIVMQVGAATESITVEATATPLETVTAERSGVVTGRQIVDIAVNGRNYTALTRTIPGAVPEGGLGGSFNGQRGGANNFTVDGQNVTDTGVNTQAGFGYRINLDSIQEFKVTTNSAAAEFGRTSGAQVQVATKSGTNQFHGTGWWFKRGEFMNANTFVNNVNNVQRPLYRFMQTGGTFGGPVKIPKLIDGKDKLFFFGSMEWGRQKLPAAPVRLIVPTALERAGNFSATRDGVGNAVTIRDPLNNSPFVGNIIPTARFNQYGPSLLNWLPLPNRNETGYNYESAIANQDPTYDQVYRVDYNISPKWRVYGRHLNSKSTQVRPYGRADTGNQLGLSPFTAPTYGWSLSGDIVYVASPSVINDLQIGYTVNGIPGNPPPADSPYYRKNSGVTLPLLFPNSDPIGLIPNLTFGNTGSSVVGQNNRMTNFSGVPYANRNPIYNITDNVTKLMGNHTFKFGIYYEYAVKSENPFRSLNSSIDFSRDVNNPGDTNWAFSNALLGNFKTYDQTSASLLPEYPYTQVEWFAQDSWKVSRKLTLNYGLRMAYIQPLYDKGNQMANFSFAAYDPAKSVQLAADGSLVPGVGDRFNGMVVSGSTAPRGLINGRGVHYSPRLGLAYQINDKTVFRTGAGVFYERIATFNVGYTSNFVTNPPTLTSPQIQNGNLSTIVGTTVVNRPLGVTRISDDGHVPTVYQYNAGIQRQLPGNMVLDVSYVGSLSRHLTLAEPFNNVALGSAWLPQNQIGANPKFDGSTTKASNFYRPYLGYTNGTQYTTGTSTNYNALQSGLNKRAGRFILGIAYTWSHALGVDVGHINNNRVAGYGNLAVDRTHVLSFNYIYDVPSISRRMGFTNNAGGKYVLDGWQLSGLTTMTSGAPTNVSFNSLITPTGTLTGAALNRVITGSEDVAPRVRFTCNPKLSHDEKSIYKFVNTACFAPSAVGSQGFDSGYNQLRAPGTHTWDASVFKKIIFTESRYIQLRLEAYNLFNHTQWSGFNSAATFNSTTGAITNLPAQAGGAANTGRFSGFGALNNVRANSQRILQIAVKLYF
ncbi:MAG: carboxypeptidase-like regulatory domain-containing protein [Bryobacteraceae bacterium]